MTTQNDQQTMLDADTAFGVVQQRVYGPAFFEKLAETYDIRPESEQQALEMMSMAAQLRNAHDHEQQKQASVKTDMLAGAREHLNAQLQSMGIKSAADNTEHYVKEAAALASFDPELAHSILSLKAAASGVQQSAA